METEIAQLDGKMSTFLSIRQLNYHGTLENQESNYLQELIRQRMTELMLEISEKITWAY